MPKKIKWLEKIRLKQDLTYLETARNIGMSKQGYWSVETGRRNPSVKTAKAIAGYFGFDWTKFFLDK